jgi:hypothetical protein
MKVTILGAGNAGCTTALFYAHHSKGHSSILNGEEFKHTRDVKVELIYDPDIPPEKVGQGSLLALTELLWESMGLDYFNNPIDATIKTGILYENWGQKNSKFITKLPFGSTAIHYSPQKLQNTILNSNKFKVIEKKITDYDDIDSDYIIDCRGKPVLDDDVNKWIDYDELENPLNAVLLGQSKKRDMSQLWTRAVATPDGWTFVIPNTSNTTSYGYLYNDTITSKKEAEYNFRKYLDVEDIQTFESLKFKKYLAKNPIIDDRILLNGNKLFFIEPLEATAINSYIDVAHTSFNWIVRNKIDPRTVGREIRRKLQQIQTFILWHYKSGSIYDSPFWEYAKALAPQQESDPEFERMLKYGIENDFQSQLNILGLSLYGTTYGQWHTWNFKDWHDGINTNLN